MRKDLVAIVCCPDCRKSLQLKDEVLDDHEDVTRGSLYCKKCDFHFPIEDGVPNLLPKALHQ